MNTNRKYMLVEEDRAKTNVVDVVVRGVGPVKMDMPRDDGGARGPVWLRSGRVTARV